MLPYLKKSGNTIIAIDGPAQGLSSGKEFTVLKYAEFIDIVAKKYNPHYIIGHSMGGQTSLYYQYKYKNPSVQKIVLLGAPSDFKIIFQNFIGILSLNSKTEKGLEQKYVDLLNRNIEQFSSQLFTSEINTKGLVVHDIEDTIVLFEEAKKIVSNWKDVQFIETKGLGHKLHDDDLYVKILNFLIEK